MYGKFSSRFFFPLLLGLCIFLVFNRHSRSRFTDYHSVNWADAGGYYVYLPATFIYDFNAAAFPDSIDHRSGDGFHLDLKSGKVFTKYNYGVALLEAPFFLLAHTLAPVAGFERDGYNAFYYRAIMIGGVVYLIAGLYFIRKTLRRKGVSHALSDLLVIIMLAGTNIYYYGINSPGFSHVYSFFLFSLFIWLTTRYYSERQGRLLFAIALVFAAAVLVRVTNAIMIFYFVFYGMESLVFRAKNLVKPRVILSFAGALVILFLPQLIYWHYVSGNLVADMYGNEGFNFGDPKIKEILFSPHNGLIPYTPVVLVFVIAAFFRSFKNDTEAISVSLMFLISLYVFSSWYNWRYGCSYGSRPFSEYMAFFVLPFATWLSDAKPAMQRTVLSLCMLFCIFNINTIYHYDGCWYEGDWDWKEYLRIILR